MMITNNKQLILFILVAMVTIVTGTLTVNASTPLPQSVISYMSARANRYHHYLFHLVRNNWNILSNSSQQAITKLGWAPPRPARSYDANGTAHQILDNNAGQDFLYMHRSMISRFNSLVTSNNDAYGKVVGWTTIPAPGDKDWPVPPNYTIPNGPSTTTETIQRKEDSFYTNNVKPYEQTFKDPAQLKKMTLGELGARIEATVHSYMHVRWSANSTYGYRPGGSGTFPYFDQKWDDPRYDWLNDFYSAQVNPHFWKLHGWIDDRIEDWRVANNLSSIKWNATWIGGPMSALSIVDAKTALMTGSAAAESEDGMAGMDMDTEMDDTMPTVMGIILSEVPEGSFLDEAQVDDFVPEEYKPKKPKKCKVTKKKVL